MSGERPLRVLYVNQTGQMSGAERSLLELLDAIRDLVDPVVACPDGALREAIETRDIPVRRLAATDVSFRLHPVHTSRGVAWVGRAGWQVRSLAREIGADLVHANTTRAGLAASMAANLGGPPAVVHIRDWVPEGRMARVTLRAVEAGASAIVANSQYTAEQLGTGTRVPVHVVHNPVDSGRFDPGLVDRAEARASLGLGDEDVVLAVIAQLTPWKGQADAIATVGRVRDRYPRVRLLVAGSAKFSAASARFDNPGFERELRDLVRSEGLEDEVRLLGERDDVPVILRASDILLVPSWREAFGRIVVEGMAMGVPVVATDVGGPSEVMSDGIEGRLLPPRDPDGWAAAIGELIGSEPGRREMGLRGRERAVAGFGMRPHAERIAAVYRGVLT